VRTQAGDGRIDPGDGQVDRWEREQRLDEAAVERLWRSGVTLRLGPEASVAVVPGPGADRSLWSTADPATVDRAQLAGTTRLAAWPNGDQPYDSQHDFLIGVIGGVAWFVNDRLPASGDTMMDGATEEAGSVGEDAITAGALGEAGSVELVDLRAAWPRLTPGEAEIALTAAALVNWHQNESFCPRCGSPTQVTAAGASRWCDHCHHDLFPRTDPAVIVAVLDAKDRLLLAHQRVWPDGLYSVVAGFVEAGESLTQAVQREVAEEVGLDVTDITYRDSQPWPFPRSLMLGFTARAMTATPVPDGHEIGQVRWFSRSQIGPALAAGELILPGPGSIAFRLIQDWLNGR
jgi:NAD+ diphosphatase